MASLKMPARKEAADKRVHAVIDFATKLRDLLQNRDGISNDLHPQLDAFVKQSPLLNTTLSSEKAQTVDSLGAELWNAAGGLIHTHQAERDPRIKAIGSARHGVAIRVFAFWLLDAAGSSSKHQEEGQRIRTFKIALRATRLCLESNELELALKVLERCSQHVQAASEAPELMQISATSQEDERTPEAVLKELSSEFYLLRLFHAWKSDRLDLANHFYSKIDLFAASQSGNLPVKAADLFYEIAKSLVKSKRADDAERWFARAFETLDEKDAEALNQDAAELRLSVGVSFVDGLLSSDRPDSRKRAWEIVTRLEETHGLSNRITVPMVKFRLLASERRVKAELIASTLLRMIKLAVLTDENFKIIMKTLRKAFQASPGPALQGLTAFICTRLAPELGGGNHTAQMWLEKATVAYVLFSTTQANDDTGPLLDDLQNVLDTISSSGCAPFSAKATHAAQTLFWKASGNADSTTAYAWCQLLRHSLFDNAGRINKARVGRKLMCMAMDDGNLSGAREAYFQMPEAARNDSLTRFLSFKLALRSQDDDLAMESLHIVAKTAAKDSTLLYACVLESQQSPMKHIAVAALQAVLDQRPPGIHLPSLLRCTARLILAQASQQTRSADEVAAEALKVFETASHHIEELRQSSREQWRDEVQWWSKNAYNFAIRYCNAINPEKFFRLLDVCTRFLDYYPNDAKLRQQDGVDTRKLLCAFLSTTALIVMGRSGEEGAEHTLQCFLHAQERIQSFKALQEKLGGHQPNKQTDEQAFCMLKFDLECVLHLQQWDRLKSALQACLDIREVERWDTLADLLIIMHEQLDAPAQDAHYEMITQLLQRIINDSWRKQNDITKVARWLRFTFTLCLGHDHTAFSLKLLEQAATMTEKGYRGKQEKYPESELQWFASTSFNHAIDLLVDNLEEEAVSWMEGALALAKWSQDNGSLHAQLTGQKEAAEQQLLQLKSG